MVGLVWMMGGVRGLVAGDVFKVWVWALGSLTLGLILTPLSFNGGKAIFELSGSKDFSGTVNKLAAWSGGAGLGDYFRICWPACGALLLFPLIEWVRPAGGDVIEKNPKEVGCFEDSARLAMIFGGIGLIVAGVILVSILDVKNLKHAIWVDVGMALGLALLLELFFRRVVMGIFLKVMRWWEAVGMAAIMCAAIPFLLSGFSRASQLDGESLSAAPLAGMLFGGADFLARFFLVFVPWCGFVFLVGWVRWRTGYGWPFLVILCAWLLLDRLSAGAVHAGVIPTLGVVVAGGMVYLMTYGNPFTRKAKADD